MSNINLYYVALPWYAMAYNAIVEQRHVQWIFERKACNHAHSAALLNSWSTFVGNFIHGWLAHAQPCLALYAMAFSFMATNNYVSP